MMAPMKVLSGGEIVRFDGHVVMNIDKMPPPADAPPPEPAPPAQPAKSRPVKSSNAK